MKSSYLAKDLNYGDLIGNITFLLNPKTIIEIGILDGYSLETFVQNTTTNTNIKAYDLFEEFIGNHANQDILDTKFSEYSNVHICKGNFYELHNLIDDNIDIIHIDIANNGDVFEYAINYYLPKLSPKGVLILEGGSLERDNVEWMHKYNKNSINPLLQKYNDTLDIKIIGNFPSITVIKNKTK